MLKHLYIKNYALIEELDIDIEPGFSVITGETGAGKSILLGAIGLLLGQRADTKAIKEGEKRCVIEAQLNIAGLGLKPFFDEEDLDYDENDCIIRRELTSAGKSRAFINDTPASVSQLKQLGDYLIDIHSQHKNLFLSKENFQLDVVDIISQDKAEVETYHEFYKTYLKKKNDFETLKSKSINDRKDEDYLRFQLDQINEVDPQAEEDVELQNELKVLEHAEDIKGALFKVDQIMNDESTGSIETIREARRTLSNISDVFQDAQDYEGRLESCYLELKDIASEISRQVDEIEFDPSRLEFVTDRLNAIYSLEQKHNVDTCCDLLEVKKDFQERLNAITHCDELLDEALKAVGVALDKVIEQGKKLTDIRTKCAEKLHLDMCKKLEALGMPNANFIVSISARKEPCPTGLDNIEFLFSANKNGKPQSIASIASGGEIARVMLSIKALICNATKLPTIIFDEIDTGVSGQIADRMAEIMKEMSSAGGTQVISITHLPQIAAMGRTHYKVYKEDGDVGTNSHIIRLSDQQRIEEIAHMLSGSTLTKAALDNAKSLLKNAK